jgi:hypothetical protein
VKGRTAWRVIGEHLEELLAFALTLPPTESVPVFCDSEGRALAFRAPLGAVNVQLCKVTAPQLDHSYDVRTKGDDYENSDGELIPRKDLARFLTQLAKGACDGGSEWGWEFEVVEE